MDCLGHIAQIYLVIMNTILMIAGLVALFRGVYLRLGANKLSENVLYRVIGIDEMFKQIAYKFIVPGCIMFVVSYFGCCGAMNMTRYQLVIYCMIMMILAGVNIYYNYVLTQTSTSLFSYFKNNVFASETDVKLYEGNPHLDTVLQVIALLSAVYLIFHIYRIAKAKSERSFRSINYDA